MYDMNTGGSAGSSAAAAGSGREWKTTRSPELEGITAGSLNVMGRSKTAAAAETNLMTIGDHVEGSTRSGTSKWKPWSGATMLTQGAVQEKVGGECNTMLVGATERSLTSGGGATLMTQGFKQEKIGQCNPMLVGATAGAGAGGDNGAQGISASEARWRAAKQRWPAYVGPTLITGGSPKIERTTASDDISQGVKAGVSVDAAAGGAITGASASRVAEERRQSLDAFSTPPPKAGGGLL